MSSNNTEIENTMSTDITNPSICIPRTFENVSWSLVKDAFDEIFGTGYVERVDVVPKVDSQGYKYHKIFIHFNKWPDTEFARNMKHSLIMGKTIKIVYNYPWYWKCVMSNVPKRKWNGPKPYVEIDGKTLTSDVATTSRSTSFVNTNNYMPIPMMPSAIDFTQPSLNNTYDYSLMNRLEEGGAGFDDPPDVNF